MWAGVEWLGIHYLVVKIVATFLVMVWNFVTRKKFLDAGEAGADDDGPREPRARKLAIGCACANRVPFAVLVHIYPYGYTHRSPGEKTANRPGKREKVMRRATGRENGPQVRNREKPVSFSGFLVTMRPGRKEAGSNQTSGLAFSWCP